MNKKIIMPIITIAFATLTLGSNLHSFRTPSNKVLLSRNVSTNQGTNSDIGKEIANYISNNINNINSTKEKIKIGGDFTKDYISQELKADKITPEIKSRLEEIFERSHKIKIHNKVALKGLKQHSSSKNDNK